MAIDQQTFPQVPYAWYYACRSADGVDRPFKLSLGGREYVLFRTSDSKRTALAARCVHMGADLSGGCLRGDRIVCPFHEWEFDRSGVCVHIPATEDLPPFARQATFPVAEVGGHVFVFNRSTADFSWPFFAGCEVSELLPARPFEMTVEMPWYLVAANGFDLQHFRVAHDRTLVSEPVIESPSPYARSIRATFAVTGHSLRDRLTRRFSGPQVTMTVTSYVGAMVLVSAEFRRTTSYGMVCVTPVSPTRTHLRVIVWVRRSRGVVGRSLFDPVDAEVRRLFIRSFVSADEARSSGIRYNPGALIDADAVLGDYLRWLSAAAQGEPFSRGCP